LSFANGDVYEGEFQKGKKHGRGEQGRRNP
jgi:hypothetical protein